MAENSRHITCLPDEIIGLILQKISCRSILNFGSTCKRFNELVNTNQWIWKGYITEVLPPRIAYVVIKYDHGNWLNGMKRFFTVKKAIYEELHLMSPKFYARTDGLRLEDMQIFFKIGFTHNDSYYFMIYILLDLIKTVHADPQRNYNGKEIHLTHLYYAQIIVRFLNHTFLAMKWAHDTKTKELEADIVLNFFVQWIDPCKLHSQSDLDISMILLVEQIELILPENPHVNSIPEKIAQGLVDELEVLEAISDVLHIQKSLPMGGMYGLEIVKAIRNRSHNLLASAVLYQAVARRCGVKCELYAFQNHLFLEWQDKNKKIYRIDLRTGEIVPQSVCPYATNNFRDQYKYEPAAFVLYIVSSFMSSMTNVNNTMTRNARWLIDFISNGRSVDNVYFDFLPYATSLLNFEQDPDLARPITFEFLHPSHMTLLEKLSSLERKDSIPPFIREIEVRPHDPKVVYAVGMVCYHKKLDYICVIRAWNMKYASDWRQRVEIQDLEYGVVQPFYSVIVLDQSERYVPQECIVHADRPMRLTHMENTLGKEFTHFDGFAYVPNKEKQMEYPEDGPITEMYRARARQ